MMIDKCPIFPVISFYNDSIEIYNSDNDLAKCSLLAYINEFFKDVQCYDRFGNIWKMDNVTSDYKINWINRLLAKTVFNPIITIKYKWEKDGISQFNDFKKKIVKSIELDDDVLTQYNDAEDLIKLISATNNLEGLFQIVQTYIFSENYLK